MILIAILIGLTSAVAAWFGSDLMRSMSNQELTRIFGVLLVLTGIRMLWKALTAIIFPSTKPTRRAKQPARSHCEHVILIGRVAQR